MKRLYLPNPCILLSTHWPSYTLLLENTLLPKLLKSPFLKFPSSVIYPWIDWKHQIKFDIALRHCYMSCTLQKLMFFKCATVCFNLKKAGWWFFCTENSVSLGSLPKITFLFIHHFKMKFLQYCHFASSLKKLMIFSFYTNYIFNKIIGQLIKNQSDFLLTCIG